MAFLANGKCRYRKNCCWSHEVPEDLKREYADRKKAQFCMSDLATS